MILLDLQIVKERMQSKPMSFRLPFWRENVVAHLRPSFYTAVFPAFTVDFGDVSGPHDPKRLIAAKY